MHSTFLTISRQIARRFVLGRQGLWPGRRWAGLEGSAEALRAGEAIQVDPLNIGARSHDIALYGRVLDYRSEHLDRLLYSERAFFEYGGAIFIYPIAELPYWRVHMERSHGNAERRGISPALLDQVRAALRERGPLGNRDFAGNVRVNSYRGRKDTGPALFHLWLTGETAIHHRRRFERVYDFSERILPAGLLEPASETEAEAFFARKIAAHMGLAREREWANGVAYALQRKIGPEEARSWLDQLQGDGVLARVNVEGAKDPFYLPADDLRLLETVAAGAAPEGWRPIGPTTDEEVVFLAPLEIVSARGRAARLFDFEYIWEVYKPAEQRRWGYYTLPVLWGDRLVARVDPRLDRKTQTLRINGFWLEENITPDAAFAAALARGLDRFAALTGAQQVDLTAVAPVALRHSVATGLQTTGAVTD